MLLDSALNININKENMASLAAHRERLRLQSLNDNTESDLFQRRRHHHDEPDPNFVGDNFHANGNAGARPFPDPR